jgi:hypothetical protein
MLRTLLILVSILLPLTSGAAAERPRVAAAPVANDSSFAWTLGAQVGTPTIASVSASAIIGSTSNDSARGLLFRAEPGIGAGKLSVGYADLSGSRDGPYLIGRWRNWANSQHFLWAHRGWSARGVLMHTWGNPLWVDGGRTYFGGEGEIVSSFATNTPWGGLNGMNLTFGLVTNIDTEHRGRRRDRIDPGEEIELVLTAGVGF